MHRWRVTIDTMKEQYAYEVDAPTDESAQQEALSLAITDGLVWGTPHTAHAERLD